MNILEIVVLYLLGVVSGLSAAYFFPKSLYLFKLRLVVKSSTYWKRKDISLHEGTVSHLTYQALNEAGRPLHINEIMAYLIGHGYENPIYPSVFATLSRHAAFVRTQKGTFGLAEKKEEK